MGLWDSDFDNFETMADPEWQIPKGEVWFPKN